MDIVGVETSLAALESKCRVGSKASSNLIKYLSFMSDFKSWLTILGIVGEYTVHDQVYDHFKSKQLFHARHHGFLGNHSTASALIQIHDSLLEAVENRELSAAFDIVDYPILMKKL